MLMLNMQLERLSECVLKGIDKSVKKFVWGKEGKRGVHVLNWETLC